MRKNRTIPFLPSPRQTRVNLALRVMLSTEDREQRQRMERSLGEKYSGELSSCDLDADPLAVIAPRPSFAAQLWGGGQTENPKADIPDAGTCARGLVRNPCSPNTAS